MLTETSLIAELRRHHLFVRLPEAALQEVCVSANVRRIAAGTTLFHQGDKADRFYFLFSGQMKLHRVVSDGQEKLVEIIRPGESFAEALLFTGTPHYPVSATALKASLVGSLRLISLISCRVGFDLRDQPGPEEVYRRRQEERAEHSTA